MDQLDEDLSVRYGKPEAKVLSRTLGGTYAQQIISKAGEAISETEQPFTAVSVVVKENATLEESLALSIKGDLLEGENAYEVEREGKKEKIDAIKRMVINKLGRVLVIHLQRFEYNWEVGTRFKLNDRFAFPPELDMQVCGERASVRVCCGAGSRTKLHASCGCLPTCCCRGLTRLCVRSRTPQRDSGSRAAHRVQTRACSRRNTTGTVGCTPVVAVPIC